MLKENALQLRNWLENVSCVSQIVRYILTLSFIIIYIDTMAIEVQL